MKDCKRSYTRTTKFCTEMVVDRSAREEEEQRRREEEEREREKREAASARRQYGDMRAISRAVSRAGAQPGSRVGLGAGVREGTMSVGVNWRGLGRGRQGQGQEETVWDWASGRPAGIGRSPAGTDTLPAGTRLATVGVWERGSATDVSAVTGNPGGPKPL